MSQRAVKVFGLLGGLVLLGLNTAVIAFYSLWQIADSAAINRMESDSGMDPTQILPNANLMWVAAHGSVSMVLALDVLAVILVIKLVTSRRRASSARRTPASV
ncbi:hypothetical protein BJH93_01505 [Kocuria polaris]|nr:hypothetical protein [Kocuria polaris]